MKKKGNISTGLSIKKVLAHNANDIQVYKDNPVDLATSMFLKEKNDEVEDVNSLLRLKIQDLETSLAQKKLCLHEIEVKLINTQEDCAAFYSEQEKFQTLYKDLQIEGKSLHKSYLHKCTIIRVLEEKQTEKVNKHYT